MFGEDLLPILREARDEAERERDRRLHVCPYDGTELNTAPNGELYCYFDGHISRTELLSG